MSKLYCLSIRVFRPFRPDCLFVYLDCCFHLKNKSFEFKSFCDKKKLCSVCSSTASHKMTSLLKKSVEEQAIDRILAEIAQIIFKCKFCDFITDDKLFLISHYRSTHVKPIEPNPHSCDQPSDEPSELDERFVCSLCFSIFLSRELVKEHMITDHGCVPMHESVQQPVVQRSNEIDGVTGKKDTDKELHRPISLRELQLKLKSSFVLKYET